MITPRLAFNISRLIHIPNKHANIDVLYGPYESILQARSTVPYSIRERGLTVGIINSYNGKLLEYWWKDGISDEDLILKELSSEASNSIPIYTYLMALLLNPLGDYITIPDTSDLEGEVLNYTYNTSENGELANVLFSALRLLLAEVARLRNSFIYGINSYKNRNTTFSSILSDYEDEAEEPLWAIDPEALSIIDLVSIGNEHNISGRVEVEKTKLNILDTGIWKSKTVTDNQDSKLIFYVTLSNNNVTFDFIAGEEDHVSIDLSTISTIDVSPLRIMLVLSKKQNDKGDNYVYITSDNLVTDINIDKGYYNFDSNSLQNRIYRFDLNLTFNQIVLNLTSLLNLAVYSKYLDFSEEVIPSKPNSSYKYDVAHITIRSVESLQMLRDISRFLLDDELIYCKENKSLYIIDDGQIQVIGTRTSIDDETDTMSDTQILNKLESLGIVSPKDGELKISNLSDITFINSDTGNKYNFKVDAYGTLKGTKILDNDKTLAGMIGSKTFPENSFRGFVAGLINYNASTSDLIKDFKLKSDRVKIGAIYAPNDTDIVHGCTHGFIELENTLEMDFPLDGCYLHCCKSDSNGNNPEVFTLPLDGFIPKGGTYLIRCKRYALDNDSNSYIKVNTFDKEWYIDGEYEKELLDLTVYNNTKLGFALVYGLSNITYDTTLVRDITTNNDSTYTSLGLASGDPKSAHYSLKKGFIDSIYINSAFLNADSSGYWALNSVFKRTSNCIYKNMFELDPAKQAFLAFTTYDSSRVRWGWTTEGNKTGTDYQYLTLNKEFIEFPNSDEKFPISNYTPKASFLYKNVCTDKTQLNMEKPNMVTCSFGIDIYKTRCFNWISAGRHDEYVFIKNLDSGKEWTKFASYGLSESDSRRKSFSSNTLDVVYNRMSGRFPANNTYYTAHKCIINVKASNVTSPTTYTYVVGRATKDGNPDLNHCSKEYTFTLYPTSYTPRIYQITDQQGFHWIEYQVWAAAAKKVNEKIATDQSTENIIPILINTGDMTLNGTRINEWLDYYNAGECLFNHLELMNVVGNNDLCGTDQTKLGTGDDPGKSNSFYFHLFYCYEISEESDRIPIVNNKYIPSLYYFDSSTTRYLMVNSEIKDTNCAGWFNLKSNNTTVNIYTGFTVPTSGELIYVADGVLPFNPIYNLIYNICNEVRGLFVLNKKEIIAACHELPFTVITVESILQGFLGKYRSISNDDKLVGSHLNLINPNDTKGSYWFSRLMEHFGIRLVLGGHKHTYACTYPVREYYFYKDNNNEWKNSYDNGPMTMQNTLKNDTAQFEDPDTDTRPGNAGKNLSKFPLTKRAISSDSSGLTNVFLPYTSSVNLTGGVRYFMCQATGYKLTSNKELPTKLLKFSEIIPETNNVWDSESSKFITSANSNLKYPMFAIISLNTVDNSIEFNIKLIRIRNIFYDNHNDLNDSKNFKFTQAVYSNGSNPPSFEYLTSGNNNYGTWGTSETILFNNI